MSMLCSQIHVSESTCELKPQHQKVCSPYITCHVLPVLAGLLVEQYLSEDVDKVVATPPDSEQSKDEVFIYIV